MDVVKPGKEPPVGCDRPIRYIIPYRATQAADRDEVLNRGGAGSAIGLSQPGATREEFHPGAGARMRSRDHLPRQHELYGTG